MTISDVTIIKRSRKSEGRKVAYYLYSHSKVSQDALPRVYRFVPIPDFSRSWNGQELYEKYQLNEDEIAFIESKINPM